MLTKRGINSVREEKTGPTVKKGIATGKKHKKYVKCACGAVLQKECADEGVCSTSVVICPKCGAPVS